MNDIKLSDLADAYQGFQAAYDALTRAYFATTDPSFLEDRAKLHERTFGLRMYFAMSPARVPISLEPEQEAA